MLGSGFPTAFAATHNPKPLSYLNEVNEMSFSLWGFMGSPTGDAGRDPHGPSVRQLDRAGIGQTKLKLTPAGDLTITGEVKL